MLRVRKQIGCSDELIDSCGTHGITIAMLDTGIFPHPDFDNRIIAFKDFVNEKKMPYDDSGHGTHVAGCMCGSGLLSEGKYKGIAPYSRLVVGRYLTKKEMELLKTWHGESDGYWNVVKVWISVF
jgi:serine protease AprX